MKWRIPEAIPSVPKDTYRIRTWLGLAIHVEPKSNVLSVTKLEKKQHEEVQCQVPEFFLSIHEPEPIFCGVSGKFNLLEMGNVLSRVLRPVLSWAGKQATMALQMLY